MNRYSVRSIEGEFQPGSNDQVLANVLGIASLDEINEVELVLLNQLYEEILLTNFPDRRLTVTDIKSWHRRWLGNVYRWAGQERSANMEKDGFPFAASSQIPKLLDDFDRMYLSRWTPCKSLSHDELIEAVAVTHVELIVIHPFREGNDRISRLLADTMMVQAGFEPMDYSDWDAKKNQYIAAIHQGFRGDYEPMKGLVRVAAGFGKI